jgi:hypothetical protein
MELIKDQHKSPALLRYADRITENRFDSNGGFNLAGGIADARWVFPFPFAFCLLLSSSSLLRPQEFRVIRSMSCRGLEVHSAYMLQLGCSLARCRPHVTYPQSQFAAPLALLTSLHLTWDTPALFGLRIPGSVPPFLPLCSAPTRDGFVQLNHLSNSTQDPFMIILQIHLGLLHSSLPFNVPLVNLSSLSDPVVSSPFSLKSFPSFHHPSRSRSALSSRLPFISLADLASLDH